jgi:hypothetical protein
MTAPLPDDELRTMLEARADRLSPEVERSVLAGFRAMVRGSTDAAGAFTVLPQALGGRGARLSGSVVALGVAFVVVLGVLGGRLAGPPDDSRDAASVGTATNAPTAAAGPDADPPLTLDAAGLERAMVSGDLDGRVVVINGRVAATGCEPATGCDYSLVGMPGLPVTLADDLITRMPLGSPFDERAVLPYAFRVRDDDVLVLLGVVGEGLDRPVRVDQLSADAPISSLAIATGWLVSRAVDSSAAPCTLPRLSPPECSAARSYALSGIEVAADATLEPDRALQVEVGPEARRGLFRPSGHGRFLVRKASDLWRVEGRYAAVVSQVEPPDPGPDDELTIDQVLAELADGSLTGRVIVIDGDLTAQSVCPRLRHCSYQLAGLSGARITVDPGIEAIVAEAVPAGPHVFIGDGVGLTYLGTVPGPFDTPMTVAQLADVSPRADEAEVRFVEGTVGPVQCLGCPMSPGPGGEQWLSGASGSGVVSVPVRVPETIDPPPFANRYAVRASGDDAWALVAAMGDEPILRIALP